ncbi:ExbD/TolR family protein [Stieleria varia]|nr:biopolymer transporter ExbD [Stieleria varia]
MRVPTHQRGRFTGANMTPMIDVVFLLIIFFLVSSHMARQENHLPVDLPVAASHQVLDPESTSLTITVGDDSQWRLGGEVVLESQIRQAMADALARDGAAAAVRIRTDSIVPYRQVEPILRAAAQIGVFDVSIAVQDPADIR